MITIIITIISCLYLLSAESVRRASYGERLMLQVCFRSFWTTFHQQPRLEEGNQILYPRELKESHQALGYKPCRVLLLYGITAWRRGFPGYMMRCTYLSL